MCRHSVSFFVHVDSTVHETQKNFLFHLVLTPPKFHTRFNSTVCCETQTLDICAHSVYLCSFSAHMDFLRRMEDDTRLDDEFTQNWRVLACMGNKENLQCSDFRKMISQEVWQNAEIYAADLFSFGPMDFDKEHKELAIGTANSIGCEMPDNINIISFARQDDLQSLLHHTH